MQNDITVAKILSHFEIVITYGIIDGAKVGNMLDILDLTGSHIIDPVTQQDLGAVPKVKATVRITNVYDNFSICKNAESATDPFSSIYTKDASLNVNESQISDEDESTVPIEIGDTAKLH